MRRSIALVSIILLTVSVIVPGFSRPVSAQEDARTFQIENRINFTYSLQIAQDAVWQVIPASHEVQTPTGPMPEFTEITFQNFVENTGWIPTGQYIHVYPVVTFPTDPNTPFARSLEQLRSVLAARPTVPDGELPMLPVVTAMQIFRSQVQYVDFATGSGIRYITAAGLDVSPLSDDRLFYTFQGLTNDGAYYIAAYFPVQSGVLPPVPEAMNAQQYNEFASGYEAYLADVKAQLDAVPPENFSPNLPVLDSLFASMTITSPAATIVTPDGAATGTAAYDNVQFSYDAMLASRIEVDLIAPYVDPGGMSMYGSLPGMTVFSLADYPVKRQYGGPVIRIIPVDTFPGSNSISDQRLAELQTFLAARAPLAAHPNMVENGPGVPEIPVLPVVNAAQVIVTKPQYIDFQNGSGVRFVTYYAQDISPISNERIFYAFQGITSDGKYVISVELPLKASVLPESIDYTTFDFETFAATYFTYLNDTVIALDGLAPGDYTPSLDMLDALIQSINVG
jgi:hypothetical protein